MLFSVSIIVSALFGLVTAQSSSSVSTISTSKSLTSSTSSASGASQTSTVITHVVEVGGANGSLVFSPNNIQAQIGDMVQFQFYSKNHSVVQSTFDQPCIPMQNSIPSKTDAFYSGFMPTNATVGSTSNILTYTIRVNDDKPVWFYCSQGKHCQEGMVGAINAPASGNKTVDAFKALAVNAVENVSPSSGSESQNGTQTETGTTSPSTESSTTTSGRSGSAAATSTGVNVPINNSASGLSAHMFFSLGATAVVVWIFL